MANNREPYNNDKKMRDDDFFAAARTVAACSPLQICFSKYSELNIEIRRKPEKL